MPSELKTYGFKEYSMALDPKRFNAMVRKHVRQANMRIGAMGQKIIRGVIKDGTELEPNRPLTVAIKRSKKPLVDRGDLWQSITFKILDDLTVFVGILQESEDYNIAKILHDGIAIPVTPDMRGLFYSLWQASEGKLPPSKLSERGQQLYERMPRGWKPLKETTTAIIIPARPFIQIAFSKPDLEQYADKAWRAAINAALAEQAGQKGKGGGGAP